MEYLHMSRPEPTDTKGVPVKLFAISSSGSATEIGTATTNGNGKFAFEWTPPSSDVYTVKAQFEGDESYWASMDTTAVSVSSAAATPTPAPEPTTFGTADLAIVAMVIIAMLVGFVNLFMLAKRK
jgi:hypothetical protein